MIEIEENTYIIWDSKLFKWSFDGYSKSDLKITSNLVKVLTPLSYVLMFKKDFKPNIHTSLQELL